MILQGKEDLRVQRTIRAIKGSFNELILEKPYEKITVKLLSERAGINKKTFYYYYKSMDDLLREMQDELFDEYLRNLPDIGAKREDMEMAIEFLLRFLVEKGSGSIRIACQDKTGMLYRKFIDVNKKLGDTFKDIWESQPLFYQTGMILYLNLIILHGIEYWEGAGRPQPVEDMIERVKTLSISGAYGLLELLREKKKKMEGEASAAKKNAPSEKKNAPAAKKNAPAARKSATARKKK